ncbi:hypothetical protein M501DRAFT_55784 [Patellaria atrata CBS 101060]|uniref:Pentatricopeptide repeat domain-containing protein n=1 Tax=Patellaria atrata CBS 101060 TaxID=1346257 RepID=A0A9P4SIC4_9PEZI|nr:hypothetical protein M501DRAFT_55784 [Patellaria atrata CBS 101060]
MRTALDRLLARPLAVRALRRLVISSSSSHDPATPSPLWFCDAFHSWKQTFSTATILTENHDGLDTRTRVQGREGRDHIEADLSLGSISTNELGRGRKKFNRSLKTSSARWNREAPFHSAEGGRRTPTSPVIRGLGKVHSVTPKRQLNDSLCARLFATSAISFETITQGLAMIGIEEIGPLAMREIAARVESREGLAQRLNHLQEFKIYSQPCMFNKAVERFAAEDWTVLQYLLASDQHPDNWEDSNLQSRLLDQYLEAKDWANVHLTLSILALRDPRGNYLSWNLLLQHYSRASDLSRLRGTVDAMVANNVWVASPSLNSIFRYQLRPRVQGMRAQTSGPGTPSTYAEDDLSFVISMFKNITTRQTKIAPFRWRELIRRLGQSWRFKELEALLLFLVKAYGPSSLKKFPLPHSTQTTTFPHTFKTPCVAANWRNPYEVLFSRCLQGAIVSWGFIHAANGPRPDVFLDNFDRGLRLVCLLGDHGVPIDVEFVKRTVRTRLWILYGPLKATALLDRRANANIHLELETMVDRIEKFWPGGLFHVPQRLLALSGEHRKELCIFLWGNVRIYRPINGVQLCFNIEKWAQGLENNSWRGWRESSQVTVRQALGYTETPHIAWTQKRQQRRERIMKSLGPSLSRS